jgi:hypothetical protein
MANKPMKSITFPGLEDTYTFVQDDTTLSVSGAAADAKVTGDKISGLKSALPSFAPNSTVVSDGEPTFITKRTDAAWYRSSDDTVRNVPRSGLLSVCIALADIAESVIIDYSDFSGSGSQNALIMAEGAELGSTIDHYWGAKPSSNFGGYGSINGNLVTVKKSLVAQNSPNTTHLFINISAASGSIKNVLWSNPESVIKIANDAKETATKAQGEIDLITEMERITPTVVSSGYRLVTNGSCVNDSNYKMLKYAVTAGEKVYIRATLDGVISFQFQTVANVPHTTNPNIVGDPIREAVDGVFTVPANATYVIINAYASNDVSGLYSVKVVSQDSPEASLPTYWQTYLSSKATDIDAAVGSVGNHGDYFSFFTDYHINSNQQHTSLILKTIRKAHGINFDVFGGDALTNHTKANALQFLHKFESDFEHNGFFPLVGNHEKNPYNNAEDVLTDDDIYPILFKRLEMNPKVSLRPRMYYRIDNGTQGIRYLFLNTDTASDGSDWYLDSAQIQWLEDELNKTPEGWYVVIFTHMFYSDSTGTEIDGIGTLLKRICNAFQSRTTYTSTSASHTFDFTNAKGKMCAIITGHTHADYADTSNAYPIIATICDTNQAQQQPSGSTVDRTTGTINEQAIDLFFIDTTAKTISTIRIGAGSDRSFTFA